MSQPDPRKSLGNWLAASARWDKVTAQMQAITPVLPSPAGGTAWRVTGMVRRPALNPDPLPVLDDIPEPIRVWKRAGITLADDGQAWFFGIGLGDPRLAYGPDATAACYRQEYGYAYPYPVPADMEMAGTRWLPEHQAPHEHCSCGFYANQDYLRPRGEASSWWEMEAELLGRYVTHEDGWRFGRQRVLAVRVPARCSVCSSAAAPPDMAYLGREGPLNLASGAPGFVNSVRPVHALCIHYLDRTFSAFRRPVQRVTFDELRARLGGIEVLPALPPGLYAR